MQVLERTEGDRDKRVHGADAEGGQAHARPIATASSASSTEELEVRASHITAAAVAAAAVTAAVVTAAADESTLRAEHVAQEQPEAGSRPAPSGPRTEPQVAASTRGAMLVSLLTLAIIGLALWLGAQWPQRSLKPMLTQLPSFSRPAPVAPAPQSAAEESSAAASLEAPGPDAIAQLQQEADEKARLLAQKRAAAEARHRREDAALTLREQRRREAEAQLANARAQAERAQAAITVPEAAAAPAAPSLAEQVKQCSALSLFARESCLWKLCDGKWGKNGCPSYERTNEGA
ncbi:phage tail protein [Herbaspirillum sp. AP02]|uniref:phage tail protein n=1 Tax=unclassified Herbaspirillum TaxID=2624150 RepID=UPI0015DB4EE2|nr:MULTISPECIES: phage tail protein [unclassified Herbaspirillum]MBG7620447.1 phage tail protein [Herbaspirillum sp. AP02]NZD67911.1 phage tail protein [Herbaspirillum sp. AP21]